MEIATDLLWNVLEPSIIKYRLVRIVCCGLKPVLLVVPCNSNWCYQELDLK